MTILSQAVPVDVGCYFSYDNKAKTFVKVNAMFTNNTILDLSYFCDTISVYQAFRYFLLNLLSTLLCFYSFELS